MIADDGRAGTRYRMLDTIHDCARGEDRRLGRAGRRRCEACRATTSRSGPSGSRDDARAPTWRSDAPTRRVRSRRPARATALALAAGVDPFIAVKIAVALQRSRTLRGYASEGRGVIRAALALDVVRASDMAQAHALYVGAALAEIQSDRAEARAMLQTCLALRRRAGRCRGDRGDALDARGGSTPKAAIGRPRARGGSRGAQTVSCRGRTRWRSDGAAAARPDYAIRRRGASGAAAVAGLARALA